MNDPNTAQSWPSPGMWGQSEGMGWGPFVLPAIQHTPGKGWPVRWAFLLEEARGEFVSWKGRRISLAWHVLLQKGSFSSKGKGNETEKCLPLSKRDGEPCIMVLSAGASCSIFASSVALRQRLEGAVLR